MQSISGMKNFVYVYIYIVLGCYASIFAAENTAVIAGQRMTMNCPINKGLIIREWKIQRNSTSIYEEDLYINWKDKNTIMNIRFGIDAKSNLYLNSTELDDAGIYSCAAQLHEHVGPPQQPFRYSAQLIVFEAEPVCSTSEEGDAMKNSSLVVMTCFANYRGFWAPTVEWRLHEANRNDHMNGRVMPQAAHSYIIPETRIESRLTGMINSTTHEHYYSCRFYFTTENYSHITNATNIPLFSFTWNSSPFGILQSNSNISVQDARNTHSIYLVAAFVVITLVAALIFIHFKRKTTVLEQPTDLTADLTNLDNTVNTTHDSDREPRTSAAKKAYDDASTNGRSYIGNDGTEYVQMNAFGRQPASVRLPATLGMFSLVDEYATIDHCFRIPPPPPLQKL